MDQIQHLYEQGVEAYQRGQFEHAANCFGTAFTRDPTFAPAYNGLGLVLMDLGALADALQRFDQGLRVDPDFVPAYTNRAIALQRLGRIEEALACLDRAIALAPNNPKAYNNRGSILTESNRPVEAVEAFDKALALKPDYPYVPGIRLLNKGQICDWSNLDRELSDLAERINRGEHASPPWALVSLLDRPDVQRTMAEAWIADDVRENPLLGPLPKRARPARVKLGYYSWDFHRHATAHLIAELFECHDRSKFEVVAFSFGPQTDDEMQKRLKAGVDRFVEVGHMRDAEIAHLSREMVVDIAIDLKGITVGHRLGIFAHRAAPIQVNYLGYPGTTGAPYMDYLIADETIIPESHRRFYREKVMALPNSYQVNDRRRKVSDRAFTRAELGLPDEGFVFCSFNNNFKILPAVFDIWMRVLTAVPGSVLWLIEDNELAAANLRKEAAARGIDPGRLVFASRVAPEDHLARQKVAGLFLDTRPYNAHTTASDALWVGLPVLTYPGDTFPSRVAASLLNAVGMPELITTTAAEYEALAIALATQPARLQAFKDRLMANRAAAPLFDTELFARNLEDAYLKMIDAHYGVSA